MKPPKTSGAPMAKAAATRRRVKRGTWILQNRNGTTSVYYYLTTLIPTMELRVIQVTGLSKSYGKVQAVTDLSFSVAAGEVLGLVGPNGAGKTTTLRSLCGIISPTSGTIQVAGFDLREQSAKAKAVLAFVPDEPQLFEYLTVDEHLRFVARLYG